LASIEIKVPDLGDFKDVAVIEVLVQAGESVEVDTPLLTLETEKATIDVPSPSAGVIEALHVNKGSRVSAGSLIATLRSAGDAPGAAPESAAAGSAAGGGTQPPVKAAPAPAAPAVSATPATAATAGQAAPKAAPAAEAAPAKPEIKPAAARSEPAAVDDTLRVSAPLAQPPAANEDGIARAHASPSVRKFARELGADLMRIQGSGQKGRITEEDVKAYVKSALSGAAGSAPGAAGGGSGAGRAWPSVSVPDFAQFGPVEVKALSRVQRISGSRLHASWVNLPHVTQFDEADITALEEARKGLKNSADVAGVKITLLAFMVRACVKALQKFPMFNSSLDAGGENLVYKKYIHIGFAADTPQGLLVPVIRDADRKDIYEIARALATLSQKARAGKLSGTEMQGGSFTISSLGGIGGTGFTPIINAPEVAIVGVSRSSLKPVYQEDALVPRLMLPLSLSYDHRVIDGANGARFISFLVAALADVHGLLEAVP
jgi:pyruvate dehydrogenase E2 component (dihydrolipoamide acetyltransferase)